MDDDKSNTEQLKVVENMHKTFLEALRYREQEILRFIAILAPALGWFVWLIKVYLENTNILTNVFVVGTIGVLFILTVGAVYSLALGFNFRYVTFQLAKMESKHCLNIINFILNGWERTAEEWVNKYKKMKCFPPEIIKVFWLAFVIAELFVVLAAVCLFYYTQEYSYIKVCIIIGCGVVCFYVSVFWGPNYYGKKLFDLCKKEKEKEKW